ncbi:hypothetical protein PARC_a1291 [Pseudoalteromonas arctica A 37-1-2]|uniref:Uncharacterized protein n=1 Tax=Pseudoalteromonas arctica A 37-1-2 TaxID=1117313 RepID=A0A290S2L4_9GAMM|nr:hypothetical protein PARC_a1291 [Pseudoalteromonas arctica A 37-1-2]
MGCELEIPVLRFPKWPHGHNFQPANKFISWLFYLKKAIELVRTEH